MPSRRPVSLPTAITKRISSRTLSTTFIARSMPVLGLQDLVCEADRERAVADRPRDALRRARAHVARREHARPDGLEQERLAVGRPPPVRAVAVGRVLAAADVAGLV